jgi:hypothetical protein
MKFARSLSAFSAFVAFGIGVSCVPVAADAPQVTYTVEPAHPVARMPFHVTYEVRWAGGPESVGVIPTDPAAVAWGTARLASATSVAGESDTAIRYTVEYVPNRHGELQVPPLTFSYVLEPPLEERPKVVADASAPAAAVTPPTVKSENVDAPGFPVSVGRNIDYRVIGISVGAVAVLGLAGLVAMRARRGSRRKVSAPAAGSTVQSLVNAARQHRLDGKFYDYYRELARAATLLAPSVAAKALREKLEHHAQQVGYGALHPTEDELEGAVRDLERVLKDGSRTE